MKQQLIFLLFAYQVLSLTLYISPSGNDFTGNGTTSGPFKTLSKALAIAHADDTIFINKGIYYYYSQFNENLQITKNINIVGADMETVIFLCQERGDFQSFRWQISERIKVSISKITMTKCERAIYAKANTTLTISQVYFNSIRAVNTEGSLFVNDCTFANGFYSITTYHADQVAIENNLFIYGNLPIDLSFTTDSVIKGNKFIDCSFCAGKFSKNIHFINNHFITGIDRSQFKDVERLWLDGNVFDNYLGFQITNSSLVVKNSSFSGFNTSGINGAALLLDKTTFSITDSHFYNNKADNGGAIYCSEGHGNIFYSTFKNNVATKYGGAIFCNKNCTILFDNVQFSSNNPEWNKNDCGN